MEAQDRRSGGDDAPRRIKAPERMHPAVSRRPLLIAILVKNRFPLFVQEEDVSWFCDAFDEHMLH
jgi:hypothetical protein